MKFRFLPLFLIISILACKKENNITSPLLTQLPHNVSLIVKINDFSAFKSELKNNDFLSGLNEVGIYDAVLDKTKVLKYIQPQSESILAFSELEEGNFEFVYVSPMHRDLFRLRDDQDKSVESITFKNKSFDKYTVDGSTFYVLFLDSNLIAASSQSMMENLIGKSETINDPILDKLYETAGSNKSASIFIDSKKNNPFVSTLVKKESGLDITRFSDWISLDLNMGQDYLNFSGISIAKDSAQNIVGLFNGTRPSAGRTSSFAPIDTDAILSFIFSDYGDFEKNRLQYLGSTAPSNAIFNTVEEVGHIFLGDKKAIVLNTYGSESISQFLEGSKQASLEYQGNEIVELNNTDFLNDHFNPIVKRFDARYYTILENAFVFSQDSEVLQAIISSFKSKATFDKTSIFETAQEVMAGECSILFVSNSSGMQKILQEDFSTDILERLMDANVERYTFAAQMVADNGFYHSNLVVRKMGEEIKGNTTSPLFTIQIDGEVVTDPQFVKNHRTNKKEIVVQDADNNLYLISTTGKVLWKKKLKGRVQGKIQQVDIYKNGRLQLAFTTDNQFLVLDRNGKEVKPFNKSFSGGILNPLSVFDYENKRDYRFVVTQGNKVFMYNGKGRSVKGFSYTKAAAPILSAPRHFRIGKRDYLVFMLENGNLKILNRTGNSRIGIEEKIDFSGNEVYLYKDKFTVTDKSGTLFTIDEKGKISKTQLNLREDHGIDATSKTLAVMNDNILSVKGKEIELELGVYTKPRIFYIYDTLYISVTDLQGQNAYLFNSNAEPIQNFPVFGSSMIDLDDMDNDRKLELVAKTGENSLTVYKMN